MERNYKKDIVSVDLFYSERPDLIGHEQNTIQSSINTSAGLLNSETNGLLELCWYEEDPDSEYFRTPYQKSQMREAVVFQTHYTIGLANDYTQQSQSYALGNISSSGSTTDIKNVIAPGVLKLLQNAGIYQLQNFGLNSKPKTIPIKEGYNYMTEEAADKRFVKVSQPDATIGNLAYVNSSNIIVFDDPAVLNMKVFWAVNVKDWHTNNYLPINKITDLAFFGKNLAGFGSAVERGEIQNMITAAAGSKAVFKSGEETKDVDYLGLINKRASEDNAYALTITSANIISIRNEQLDQSNKIVENTDKIITNTDLIEGLYRDTDTIFADIEINKTGIAGNKTTINQVIEELHSAILFVYKGDWVAGSYKKGEVVNKGIILYLAKVDTTQEPSLTSTDWNVFSASSTIDLSNYYMKSETYNKTEVDASLLLKAGKEENNQFRGQNDFYAQTNFNSAVDMGTNRLYNRTPEGKWAGSIYSGILSQAGNPDASWKLDYVIGQTTNPKSIVDKQYVDDTFIDKTSNQDISGTKTFKEIKIADATTTSILTMVNNGDESYLATKNGNGIGYTQLLVNTATFPAAAVPKQQLDIALRFADGVNIGDAKIVNYGGALSVETSAGIPTTLSGATPITPDDFTTKAYVDAKASAGGLELQLSPLQTENSNIGTKQTFTFPTAQLRTITEFVVEYKDFNNPFGYESFTFINNEESFGSTTQHLGFKNGTVSYKQVNVSGNGGNGQIWIYTNIAIQHIYVRKKKVI